MRLRNSVTLGAGLLVAILLVANGGGGSSARAAHDSSTHAKVIQAASATEYGLRTAPGVTPLEYGLL